MIRVLLNLPQDFNYNSFVKETKSTRKTQCQTVLKLYRSISILSAVQTPTLLFFWGKVKMDKKQMLGNGHQLPVLGLGTWDTTTEKELEVALDVAFEAGYRHIDTAYAYQNEALIGKVLKKWIDSGKISRSDVFITSKLPIMGLTPERAPYFLQKSLENLQLSYMDLYLIHVPFGVKYYDDSTFFPIKDDGTVDIDPSTNLEAVWKALEKTVDEGKVKSLGVSNMNLEQLKRLYEIGQHKPACVQVELHAYLQQKVFREECTKLGVSVCAYAPLGSPTRHPAFRTSAVKWEPFALLNDPVVKKIADSKGKTPAQILIRFLIQLGVIVIPKSRNPERIKENCKVFDTELSASEMEELAELDKGEDGRSFRFDAVPGIVDHPEYPFSPR